MRHRHLELRIIELLLVLLELLLLLLHVVVIDTEFLVTMGKAASFLVWTALSYINHIKINYTNFKNGQMDDNQSHLRPSKNLHFTVLKLLFDP